MWKYRKRQQTETSKQGAWRSPGEPRKWLTPGLLLILLCGLLSGCGQQQVKAQAAAPASSSASAETTQETLRIGLILTSRDDPENEAVQTAFEALAEELGADLSVKTPDVSAAEAAEARGLEYRTFALCDVDPIEYQMLAVNELIAEDVDVIAIHANHTEALESVLSAARGVGVRVIAFEQPVTDASCDGYAETSEEAVAVIKSE